jgi:protein involved in polysaccharide export with SLBB domain
VTALARSLLLLSTMLAASAGCAVHYSPRPARVAAPSDYTLGPGDVIMLQAFGEPDINFRGPLAPTGEVGLPLVGVVHLMGETIHSAREKLNRVYGEFLKDVNIYLTVERFRADSVHVMGEVRAPGTYPMIDAYQTTAISALQIAGSFDPVTAATSEIRVIRGALDAPDIYRVDLDALLDGEPEPAALDLLLEPGDIVYVPPRWVTSVDRFVRQFLAPVTAITGATVQTVAGTGGIPGVGVGANVGGGGPAP